MQAPKCIETKRVRSYYVAHWRQSWKFWAGEHAWTCSDMLYYVCDM